MNDDWTDEELRAAVLAYRDMQAHDAARRPYSKRAVYRDLAARLPRSEKAFEYRMQNISAVLHEAGADWVPGLKPAGNVGANVKAKLEALLEGAQVPKAKTPPAAAYKAKLPGMRLWLINVARAGCKVVYSDVMEAFGVDRFSLRFAMDYLGHQSENLDEPIITALIVSKATGRCSSGIVNEFGIVDDEVERQRLYAYWSATVGFDQVPADDRTEPMDARAAKFASVAVRPDQAAFRRRVFHAYDGKCVLTGCDLGVALDAAHKAGRKWRDGQNMAGDGFLLRKDVHALYDAGLLTIDEVGLVRCTIDQYKQLDGLIVRLAV